MDEWQRALGWGADFEAAMEPHVPKGLTPARVVLVYRKQLKVLSQRGEHWARTGGRLIHKASSVEDFPAVGDWVAARIPESGEALVHTVLPRRSAFIRKVPGENAAPHVLAANIDTILVVMGLDQDFNLRRLERFLTLAWETKAAEEGQGLEPLAALFSFGHTVALLGSSGVGKSTLVNHLVGQKVMETGTVRDDGRGRHTTSRRELLLLPTGGAVIDTPGLREIQMWTAQDGLAKTFDDIEALSKTCRFSDCQHQAEPGCAVKAALADGTLPATRFDSWLELEREMAWLGRPAGIRGRPETKRRERMGHGTRRK